MRRTVNVICFNGTMNVYKYKNDIFCYKRFVKICDFVIELYNT